LQVAEGNEVAEVRPSTIEDLFEETYRPMVRLALVMTGSNEVAEDLVQDCFARLHGRWEHVENPGGYMRISVVNACKQWFRSRDRERKRMRLVGAGEQVLSLETQEMLDELEEDRLRAAFDELATTATFAPDAWAQVRKRRAARTGQRFLSGVGALALAAAAIAGLLLVTGETAQDKVPEAHVGDGGDGDVSFGHRPTTANGAYEFTTAFFFATYPLGSTAPNGTPHWFAGVTLGATGDDAASFDLVSSAATPEALEANCVEAAPIVESIFGDLNYGIGVVPSGASGSSTTAERVPCARAPAEDPVRLTAPATGEEIATRAVNFLAEMNDSKEWALDFVGSGRDDVFKMSDDGLRVDFELTTADGKPRCAEFVDYLDWLMRTADGLSVPYTLTVNENFC